MSVEFSDPKPAAPSSGFDAQRKGYGGIDLEQIDRRARTVGSSVARVGTDARGQQTRNSSDSVRAKTPAAGASRLRFSLPEILFIGAIATIPVGRFLAAMTSSQIFWLIPITLILCAVTGRVSRPWGAPAWGVSSILILIAGFVSGAQSDLRVSVTVALQLAILVGLTPAVVRHYKNHRTRIFRGALIAAIFVQTFSATIGILQSTLGLEFLGYVARNGRANGLADHPNTLALMCVVAILIGVDRLLAQRGRGWLINVAVVGINTGGLFASGSLSNLIALAIGFAVLMFARHRIALALTLGAVIALVLAAGSAFFRWDLSLLTSSLEDRVDNVTGEQGNVGSLAIREQTWTAAWQYIQREPLLGVGLDPTNQAVYGTTVTHNYLLQFWYRGGIALLLVALIVSVAVVVVSLRSFKVPSDGLPAGVMLAILTFAFTAAFFTQPYYWMPLLVAAGMISLRSRGGPPDADSPVRGMAYQSRFRSGGVR